MLVFLFIVIVYDECDVVHDGDYDDSLQGKTRNYCDHNNVGFKLKEKLFLNSNHSGLYQLLDKIFFGKPYV